MLVLGRPWTVWLTSAAFCAAGIYLMWGSIEAISYVLARNQSHLIRKANWIPLIGLGTVVAFSGVGLILRWRWVRFIFLAFAIIALLRVLSLLPIVMLAFTSIQDPAARASIYYVAAGAIEPTIIAAVAIGGCFVAFRYLRRPIGAVPPDQAAGHQT